MRWQEHYAYHVIVSATSLNDVESVWVHVYSVRRFNGRLNMTIPVICPSCGNYCNAEMLFANGHGTCSSCGVIFENLTHSPKNDCNDSTYHVMRGDREFGPNSFQKLQLAVSKGYISRSDLVRRDGSKHWISAERIDGLFPRVNDDPVKASQPDKAGTLKVPCGGCGVELEIASEEAAWNKERGRSSFCPICILLSQKTVKRKLMFEQVKLLALVAGIPFVSAAIVIAYQLNAPPPPVQNSIPLNEPPNPYAGMTNDEIVKEAERIGDWKTWESTPTEADKAYTRKLEKMIEMENRRFEMERRSYRRR